MIVRITGAARSCRVQLDYVPICAFKRAVPVQMMSFAVNSSFVVLSGLSVAENSDGSDENGRGSAAHAQSDAL
jgi:hypothetical protein